MIAFSMRLRFHSITEFLSLYFHSLHITCASVFSIKGNLNMFLQHLKA